MIDSGHPMNAYPRIQDIEKYITHVKTTNNEKPPA